MYCSLQIKLLLACSSFVALSMAAPSGPALLRKRGNRHTKVQGPTDPTETNDGDLVHFDNLHKALFPRKPFRTPSQDEILRLYPDTYFYENSPVLSADYTSHLSKAELQEADQRFGGVHVIDPARMRYTSFWPRFEQPAGALDLQHEYPPWVRSLASFDHMRRIYEKHYGRSAAVVAYGPALKLDRRDGPVSWEQVWRAKPTPRSAHLSPSQLREVLIRDGYFKMSSMDSRTSMAVRLHDNGRLQQGLFGDFGEVQRIIYELHG